MSPWLRELLIASPILLALLLVGLERYKRYRVQRECLSFSEACEKMETWYRGLEDGWHASLQNSRYIPQRLDNPLYGEITFAGMEAMASQMQLTSSDVFYD